MKIITTTLLIIFAAILFSQTTFFIIKTIRDFKKKLQIHKGNISGKGKSRADTI